MIIRTLQDGPKRFKDISEMIPTMSDKMLVERLKELETAGILSSSCLSGNPVRIEYGLTEMGKALQPVMDEVQQWAESWVK
ncbi:transcriptional regulator [Collibacillus ludicampi]|uniref:Transcriptional regulator n=1 Tax=Collibacillus ludicampi TaxID=2771369 RepID=A0AAV4LK46_9BACL|nr:transcriptional regulator [Collibacillus ludicampi]